MLSRLLLGFVFVLSLFSIEAKAAYVINPDHSQILFSVSYLKVSQIRGSMTRFRGHASLDRNGLPTAVELVINSDSITTFDERRDYHLKKEDFFAVKRHPEIHFKAEGLPQKIDEDIYSYPGEITFFGKKHPVVLQLIALGQEVDPWGKVSTFFQVRTQLNRKELGLHWNRVLDQGEYLVGESVFIDATIQLQPRDAQTAFSTHMVPGPRAGRQAPAVAQAPSLEEQIQLADQIPTQDLVVSVTNDEDNEKPLPSHSLTFLEHVQLGMLAFFSLIGIFATGIGVKFWLEKKREDGKRHFIGEVVFLILFFFYSTWLYTFTKIVF